MRLGREREQVRGLATEQGSRREQEQCHERKPETIMRGEGWVRVREEKVEKRVIVKRLIGKMWEEEMVIE